MGHTKGVMAERIAHHTGQTVEQIRVDWDRDRWFIAGKRVATASSTRSCRHEPTSAACRPPP